MPVLLVYGALLLFVGILFAAHIKARRRIAELCAQLDAAQVRQESDKLELTQRSELDNIKDEFVSNVSHELRTPLTSIRGALGLLSSGVLGTVDVQAQNLLRIALTNTERLIRLINDILDLQRMDSGLSVLQVRRCSLPDLVYQAVETMVSMADAADVKLLVSPAAKAILPSIFFDVDSDRILQVLTNLLSNAIKFSPAGSAVTIEVEAPPDALIFRIVDQGRGIPEEQLETIFDRFSQVEHSDARQRGGTGLGLAICRSIILQHGGSIWAQRNPVRGVAVCVKLPRAQRTYDVATPEPVAATEPPHSRPRSNADSAVLICDNDGDHRSLTARQLRAHGHTVLEACTATEATAIAQRRPANSALQAILLDLHLSEARGWELLRVLISNASTSAVPIVVLSIQRASNTFVRLDIAPHAGQFDDSQLLAGLSQALHSGRAATHVLLVEEDDDLAAVFVDGFNSTGVTLDRAATLDRAMACCRDRRPDLMVLDLTMPDGNGFAMVEWLRVHPELRSMPLIVYSGCEIPRAERAALRLGPTSLLERACIQTQDVEQLVLSLLYDGHLPRKTPSTEPDSQDYVPKEDVYRPPSIALSAGTPGGIL